MVGLLFLVGCGLVFVQLRRSGVLRRITGETWFIAISGLSVMALFWYFGRPPHYPRWFGPPPEGALGAVVPFLFMCVSSVVLRMLLPWSLAWGALGITPKALGAGLGERSSVTWIYAVLLAIGLVAAVSVSHTPAFLARYPMCRRAISGDELDLGVFLIYQFVYAFLFISGESFSRGYLVIGLGRTLGPNAIFFAMIPYVMSHYGKPMLETFGAILTALVLGTLAYVHRSFWYGALVHWLVALSMDLAALRGRGVFLVY